MPYKIAVASSDGNIIDLHVGSARSFRIYEVQDDGSFAFAEERAAGEADAPSSAGACPEGSASSCGEQPGGGCGGCGQGGEISSKVQLIADCRCVVCARIGFNVQKQLERKAIAAFDVECPVEEALTKISSYFLHVDKHESLARR